MKKLVAIFLASLFFTNSVFAEALTYSKVESASLYLYDANMCGDDVNEKTKTEWRDDCHLIDVSVPLDTTHTDLTASFINSYKTILDKDGDGNVDLSGGYHDAGDFVKFGLPQMYTAVTLQWVMYEFGDTIEKNGDKGHYDIILNRFTDYIKKCTFLDNNGNVIAFCYQVGDGAIDHDYWGSPEAQAGKRPAFFATSTTPATDITALAAASLAADYVNTKNEESLKYAKALYSFTNNASNKAVGDDHAPSNDEYYKSGGYEDDIAMASAWLYIATNETSYLTNARNYLKNGLEDAPGWIYCWDDTWLGTITLIAEKENDAEYWGVVKETLDIWQKDYNTPEGYACIDEWGSARYNTDAQFLAVLYSKYNNDMSYANWAKGQMEYLLGKNKANKCYVTGVSENSVKYPHHAAATGFDDPDSKAAHKYTLYGALVGGPGKKDEHIDVTNDYKYNEVTLDYNAGFVGAITGLKALLGDSEIDTEVTTGNTDTPTETTTVSALATVWDFTDSSWSDKTTKNVVYSVNGLSVRHNSTSNSVAGFKFDRNSKATPTEGYYIKLAAKKDDKIIVYVNADSSGGKAVSLTLLNKNTNEKTISPTVNATKKGDFPITFTVPSDGTYLIYTTSTSAATAFYNKVVLDRPAVKGDVDLNGEVNSVDTVLILKHISHINLITNDDSLANADVNSDGYITLIDAILSLNKDK